MEIYRKSETPITKEHADCVGEVWVWVGAGKFYPMDWGLAQRSEAVEYWAETNRPDPAKVQAEAWAKKLVDLLKRETRPVFQEALRAGIKALRKDCGPVKVGPPEPVPAKADIPRLSQEHVALLDSLITGETPAGDCVSANALKPGFPLDKGRARYVAGLLDKLLEAQPVPLTAAHVRAVEGLRAFLQQVQ